MPTATRDTLTEAVLNEALTGLKSSLAVKIYGTDLETLEKIATDVGPMFGVKPESLGWWHQTVFLTLITASQAFLNHRGIRIASKITDVSGYLIFVVTVILVASLVIYSPVKVDFSRLVTFTNFTGIDGGQWPAQTMAMAFLSGLLLTAYTITGFDASAHTSEETHDAARNVPRGSRCSLPNGCCRSIKTTSWRRPRRCQY